MSACASFFGETKSGEPVTAYTISGVGGMRAVLLDYGATLQALAVPDARGVPTDVVLGYDSVEEYEENSGFVGATIGRVGNRIGAARFSLGGRTYMLEANDGENHLHGGRRGFDKRVWQAEQGEGYVRFSRLSPDGEENYPGDLRVSVTYKIDGDNALHIIYDADADKDTLANFTNHSYFNLNGGGSVLSQQLRINAERFTELGAGTLPTGRILPVEGTPLDFRTLKPVGRDVGEDDPQLALGGGYDHNFVLSSPHAAVLRSEQSGIEMNVYTDMPGVQLYSANFLSERRGKGGQIIGPRCAVCLETQLYPNAMNCWGFPSPVLHRGEHLHSETCYAFAAFD